MASDLSGQVAVITGVSRGIGRAIALRLAAGGARLHLTADGTAEELAATAALCRDAGAPAVSEALDDLERPGAAEAVIEAALTAHGRIEVLVNNAGVRSRRAFGDYTRADFDRVVGVNLAAPFFASQAAARVMRAQGGGRIVNVASQLGLVAAPYTALYGTTKAALIQLTRAMALELAPHGIRVNAVCPGPVATESFLAGRHPGELEQRARALPVGRFGRPEEVAAAVAFLVSDDAGFVAGHALVMDGGYVIH